MHLFMYDKKGELFGHIVQELAIELLCEVGGQKDGLHLFAVSGLVAVIDPLEQG